MSKAFQTFCTLLKANPYSKKKERHIAGLLSKSILAAAIFFAVAILLEIYVKEYYLIKYSAVFSVLFLLLYLYIKKTKKTSHVRLITGLLIVCFATFSFLFGTGEGFGSLWMILLPALLIYLVGYRSGLIMSLYLWLLAFLCLKVPSITALMPYTYPEKYRSIFFIAVTVETVFSSFSLSFYYINQLKEWELENDLEKAVLLEHEKLADISLKTILVISNTVEAKDEYTSQHSHRVADFSCMIAKKLGWDDAQITQLRNIAQLHDIGKISVRESVLNKPGRLTDDEFAEIKRHTVVGGDILHDLTLIPNVALGAKFHHERYDSRGYPTGLAGTAIPLEARIIGIADSFDAMRYRRVYRGECDPDYILGELQKGRGTQFDPELLDIFLKVIEEEHLLPEKVD